MDSAVSSLQEDGVGGGCMLSPLSQVLRLPPQNNNNNNLHKYETELSFVPVLVQNGSISLHLYSAWFHPSDCFQLF